MPSRLDSLPLAPGAPAPSTRKVTKTKVRPAIQPIKTTTAGHFTSLARRAIAVPGASPRTPRASSHYWLRERPVPLQPDPRNEQARLYNRSLMSKFDYRVSASPPLRPSPGLKPASLSQRPSSARSRDGLYPQGRRPSHTLDVVDIEGRPNPDVYVVPKELKRKAGATDAASDPWDISQLLQGGKLTLRVVVHSHDGIFGMTRQFDMDTLRASIPDGNSPRTPSLDRTFSQAFLDSPVASLPPASPFRPERDSNPARPGQSPRVASSPSWEVDSKPSRRPMPVDIHYARGHLPALAAIMMNQQVKRGDRIELPVPQPDAWPDTIGYVYTGDPTLLTADAKQNILYLGGKI
ncbi:hypothetical protein B0I35DRAFT_478302 [Stachybotrys elegans]|uniref:Uncharacterized protein n=1 Tax=Stachybotrys elegans TaxID=80388 RepID=A0A8K0SRK1_9HYPO|nr:hypothetical protein B0I35DRAFT_478302 [Stachybotrys elegans]